MLKVNRQISQISLSWNTELLFALAERHEGVCLFTSVADKDQGKNILGINPVLNLKSAEEIDIFIRENKNESDFPAILGYVSYDYKHNLEENGLFSNLSDSDFPDFLFTVFEHYIIAENSDRNNITLITLSFPLEHDKLSTENLFNLIPPDTKEGLTEVLDSSLSKKDFMTGVDKIRNYILQGDLYQANLTRKISGKTQLSPVDTAYRLKNSNPIEFGVFAKIDGKYIISTSPERFFKIRKGYLTASPIKGTIQRSDDPDRDKKNLESLMNSKKDIAELAMIVDLLRNDMNKICSNVKVEGFPLLMELKNVYHLYSDISGKLKKKGFKDIIKALFPGGSITGCPKIRACQIIEELEKEGRGPYTGNFGYIGFNGDMDFNIMIRTLLYDNGNISVGTGGGITLLSDPEEEYYETVVKAMNIMRSLGMEGE